MPLAAVEVARGGPNAATNAYTAKPRVGFGWVVVIVLAIWGLSLVINKQISGPTFIGGMLFLVGGAVYPPLFIAVGLVILFAIVFRNGATWNGSQWVAGPIFTWFNTLSSRVPTQQPFTALGPTLPTYKPPPAPAPYTPLGPSQPPA